jgi:hypothetical protein
MKYLAFWFLALPVMIGLATRASPIPDPFKACSVPKKSNDYCHKHHNKAREIPASVVDVSDTENLDTRDIGGTCFFKAEVMHGCEKISRPGGEIAYASKFDFLMFPDFVIKDNAGNIINSKNYPFPGTPADITTTAFSLIPEDNYH